MNEKASTAQERIRDAIIAECDRLHSSELLPSGLFAVHGTVDGDELMVLIVPTKLGGRASEPRLDDSTNSEIS